MESMRDDIHTIAMEHTKTEVSRLIPNIAREIAMLEGQKIMQEMVGHLPTGRRQAYLPPVIDADQSNIVYAESEATQAAHRLRTVDPYDVQEKIDSEHKNLQKKPALKDRLNAFFNPSSPDIPSQTGTTTVTQTDDRPITEERPGQPARKRRLGGDQNFTDQEDLEEEKIDTPELPENHHDWTSKQWKQARQELDQQTYNELFDDVFPNERLQSTPKKRNGGKQTKNVTRRQLLTGNKED
jgi:hypothetical protein